MVFIIFVLSALSLGILGTLILNKGNKVRKRVERLITKDSISTRKKEITTIEDKSKKPSIRKIVTQIANNIKTSDEKRNKIETELQSADIPLKVEEFIAIRIIIMAAAFLLCLLFGLSFLTALIIGLIGLKLPSLYVKKKKTKRLEASAKQLPQVLETMTNALKSGFSFMQALQLVSSEIPAPLGKEFKQTIKEVNLGISMEEAFTNLLSRLPNKDVEIMVTAVLIQRSTGGNLAQILETIQETITERVRLKDELKALTSQGRMSALVITLLPVLLGLFLNLMNPDYFVPLLTNPFGLIVLLIGVFSGILGWIFIMKIVKVEV